ncbi:molybdopterin molybdotransferase MoeA [Acinetobacter gerneri]|uniref:molybdopterin molybdotransferase MoeA n=1 Tax=Acinetobacter gerneri TaxID=202952 RepID=UPI002936A470|nr:gephyrin-like molybdotransferase Glp [Acinetobacter gerneri]MDV2439084.1 molybdopterin molybdotransferase MoeA [Acinetobacter gerneri]
MNSIVYEQALSALVNQVTAVDSTEMIALMQVKGRVLAEDIVARFDAPQFDNSAMDGYAICDLEHKQWQIIDQISAGDPSKHIQLSRGQAVRIFTGAAIPQGTDAVIAQEDCELNDQFLRTGLELKHMQHIRFRAEEYALGDVLLDAGKIMHATDIGVAASQGYTYLNCVKKIKVCVFSSGNELQNIGNTLRENQIYDSNRLMLLSLLEEHGFDVIDGGILADDLDLIKIQLKHATDHSDVILLSGGASVGDKDYSKIALQQLGKLHFWKLKIKPGKPFAWGQIAQIPTFLLPGNPVASWVTFLILVLPALKKISGLTHASYLPKRFQAEAHFELNKTCNRQQFMRGNISFIDGKIFAEILKNQGSAMLSTCSYSNALIVIPSDTLVTQGQKVDVIYLSSN